MIEYLDRAEKLKTHLQENDEKRSRQALGANGGARGGGGGAGKAKYVALKFLSS